MLAADAAKKKSSSSSSSSSSAGTGTGTGTNTDKKPEQLSEGGSFWAPYIRLLPRDFPTLPIFFTEEELQWLKGSAALQNIATLQTDVRSEYDQLSSRVPAFRRFEYRTFLWARLAVMTRAFSVYINVRIYRSLPSVPRPPAPAPAPLCNSPGCIVLCRCSLIACYRRSPSNKQKAKLQAMIPLADMLNHHRLANKLIWGYQDAMDSFALTASASYSAGDQLYLSYGSKSNTALLVDYGFVLDDNPHKSAVIVLKLPYDSPLFNTKMLFFDDTTQYVRIYGVYSHRDTQTAFSVARFICGTADELTPLLKQQSKFKLSDVTPINSRNEACALKLIAEAATMKLNDYPRTLEQDLQLLNSSDPESKDKLSVNIRNCLHVTVSEKQVLTHFASLGQAVVPLLVCLLGLSFATRTQSLAYPHP